MNIENNNIRRTKKTQNIKKQNIVDNLDILILQKIFY